MSIRAIGRRGREKMSKKREALRLFFSLHHSEVDCEVVGYCQVCSGRMRPDQADPMHKRKASLCGGEEPSNIIAGHRRCHQWADYTIDRRRIMEASEVSVLTGGVVAWPMLELQSLRAWVSTGDSRYLKSSVPSPSV